MTLHRTLPATSLTLLLAALAAAPLAHAAPEQDFYVGASLGAAAVVPDGASADTGRRGSGLASPGLFAGARLGTLPIVDGWPVHAELGYQNVARHTLGYRVANSSTDLTARGHSLYAAVKVDAPLTAQFSLYGKLGLARNSVDGSTPAGQPVIDIKGSHSGLLTAFGVQYAFANNLTLRGELASYGKSSANSKLATANVGLAYRF
jgi:OOP family OmpA-OmpF porin